LPVPPNIAGLRKAGNPSIESEVDIPYKGVTLALVWQEGLDKGQWNCSYATFCRRYNQWRVKHQLSMRQVYKGGEKLFVDYCGLTMPLVNADSGFITTAQIFVACLGASNYTYAEATPSQELPHWIGSHQVGVQTVLQVEAMFERKQHEEQAFRTVRGLQSLATHYGSARVEAACHRANVVSGVGARAMAAPTSPVDYRRANWGGQNVSGLGVGRFILPAGT
jgi:hypothetical protein